MKTVLIMRHAKSSWSNSSLSDHDRPLNDRGHRDAPQMGELLKAQGLVPELIISSTAKRAWQTAENVAHACGYEQAIELTGDLYHAPSETYFEILKEVKDHYQIVMVVGHNPGISDFLDELTDSYEQMTTGNIAHVELDIASWDNLEDGTIGRLCNLWRPKEL